MQAIPVSTDAAAIPGPRQGEWTAADWDNLPHDEARYEIINIIRVKIAELFPSVDHCAIREFAWVIIS